LEPNDLFFWTSKGRALHELGRNKEAIECYDKVLTADPNDATALINKGLDLDITTLILKGLALGRMGYYLQAIKCFDKVLSINPNNVDALRHKEKCLHELRKINQPDVLD